MYLYICTFLQNVNSFLKNTTHVTAWRPSTCRCCTLGLVSKWHISGSCALWTPCFVSFCFVFFLPHMPEHVCVCEQFLPGLALSRHHSAFWSYGWHPVGLLCFHCCIQDQGQRSVESSILMAGKWILSDVPFSPRTHVLLSTSQAGRLDSCV